MFLDKLKDLNLDFSTDQKILAEHSSDASMFKVFPAVVIFPKNKEEVQKIVNFVNKENAANTNPNEKINIVSRASGTCMSGGPLGSSIILSFKKYMNKILETNTDFAVCEPGVMYSALEIETLKHGVIFPSYPASRELAAMGGIVANNASGEKALTYGSTINWIQEVEMVLSDGSVETFSEISEEEIKTKISKDNFAASVYKQIYEIIKSEKDFAEIINSEIKVSKNSTGYFLSKIYNKEKNTFNIAKLICGSQGTLGIMTKMRVRMVSPKTEKRMVVMFLKDLKDLGDIINLTLKYKPETFESYDDHTFKIAIKYLPNLFKHLSLNLIKLPFLFLPDIFKAITGGVPKLILMAEFVEDTDTLALEKANALLEELKKININCRLTSSPTESQKYWSFRRESFNLLRSKIKGAKTAPFIDDIIVPVESLAVYIPALEAILDRYKLTYTIAGHVGNGNFHVIPLINMENPNVVEIIKSVLAEVVPLVKSLRGSMSAEHNDGLVRSYLLPEFYSPGMIDLFERVKNAFDKENIFNPGKKVYADELAAWKLVNRSN